MIRVKTRQVVWIQKKLWLLNIFNVRVLKVCCVELCTASIVGMNDKCAFQPVSRLTAWWNNSLKYSCRLFYLGQNKLMEFSVTDSSLQIKSSSKKIFAIWNVSKIMMWLLLHNWHIIGRDWIIDHLYHFYWPLGQGLCCCHSAQSVIFLNWKQTCVETEFFFLLFKF